MEGWALDGRMVIVGKGLDPSSLPQDQYVFVHDCVNELVVCGDTEVVTADLRRAMNRLQDVGQEGGVSGYEKQYKVSGGSL